jgi:hypothetical protein
MENDQLPQRTRVLCVVCADTHFLSRSFVFNQPTVCTCGAGPVDELTLHRPDCDSVPCVFCQVFDRARRADA